MSKLIETKDVFVITIASVISAILANPNSYINLVYTIKIILVVLCMVLGLSYLYNKGISDVLKSIWYYKIIMNRNFYLLAIIVIIVISLFLSTTLYTALVLIGSCIIFYGMNIFIIKNKSDKDILKCNLLFFIGALMISITRINLLTNFNASFNFMNAFTLGSFALIISTFSYENKKQIRTTLILSSISCMVFFVAGLLPTLLIIFPSTIQLINLEDIFIPLRVALVFVGSINLVIASTEFFRAAKKK